MKKIVVKIIVVLILLTGTKVSATCGDDTLNNWAEKLNIKMVEVNDKYVPPGNLKNEDIPYSYLLMLDSPRNDLKVTAKDTYSTSTYNVDYDTDYKNFVVGSEIHFIDKKYTFNIYMSSSASTCPGEKMKTITYTVPKYNEYNDTVYCEENPDAEICGSYKRVDPTDKIDNVIDEYYEKEIQKELDKNIPWYIKLYNIVNEYYMYILVPIISLAIIYNIIILIVKKSRENK